MLEFRVLGPLEVIGPAGTVPVGGAKQRVALLMLVLRAGEFVSRQSLIDALWPDSPPATAAQTVESYVSRLRGLLRGAGATGPIIEFASAGYRLALDGCRFDHVEFSTLATRAGAAAADDDHAAAAGRARAALALWRGPALAGLAGEPALRADATALEADRAQVVEIWATAELALGRDSALIGPLSAEAARYPTRERLIELLMLAMYRSGRQADALEVFRTARGRLVDELGLEPGPRLHAVNERILRHDPALILSDVAPAANTAPSSIRTPGMPTQRRRSWLAASVAVTCALAIGGGIWLLSTGAENATDAALAATLRTPALGVLDGATGQAGAAVALPAAPSRVTAGLGAAWATSYDDGTLLRIDPRRSSVTQTIHVGHGPTGVAVAAGDVWVANTLDGTVSRVDGETNEIVQRIKVGTGPTDIAAGTGAVWVSNTTDGTVSRLYARTGAVLTTTRLAGGPTGIAVGAGGVWVAESAVGAVAHLDARTGRLRQTIHVGSQPSAIAVGANGVWVANQLDSTVSLIDPQRDAVTLTRAVLGTPTSLAAVGHRLWVGARDSPILTQLDEHGAARTVALHSPVGAMTTGTAGLLVGALGLGLDHRGGTLTARSSYPLKSVSPYDCCDLPPNVRDLSYDGLLAFSRAPGAAGTLVPDLALQVPRAEAGGRVYRFRLRPGVRYWTGAAVRASDIRRGLERAADSNDNWATYLQALPGAPACPNRPRPCDLRAAVKTDDRTGTITLHLSHPDPELLLALGTSTFAPAPLGPGPTPGTGPYRIARFIPGRLLDLTRNRYFRPLAPAARPSGYADRIVWKMGTKPTDNVAAVLAGRADYTPDPPSVRQRDDILLHAPGQLHLVPLPASAYLVLNTHAAPFDDIRVRRALNYAVDRDAVARLFGGTGNATAICQILPATIPGHRPYCPYTSAPSGSGRWASPDLDRARKLIAASGTRGAPVTILTQATGYAGDEPSARYFARLLRTLGYRARLRSSTQFGTVINDVRRPPQAVTSGFFADYPSASQWIRLQLSCATWDPPAHKTNHAQFCDPTADRWARAAAGLQTSDPVAANRLWARADRRITNQAPWVPTVSESTTDLVARRVSNYQHPGSFVALDQLWVR